MSDKPRGYITRILVLDSETSGIAFNSDDPSYNRNTGEKYQALSMGLIVADASTLKPIEKLYLEIQFDGAHQWNFGAEKIHGFTKEYLKQNGVTREEAAEKIGNLIIDHWGPSSPICVLGHNPSFDIAFLRELMREFGIELKFGSKAIDTNSIGFTVYGTHNSDDLFETVGIPLRTRHNALDDAEAALKVVQITRKIAEQCFGG